MNVRFAVVSERFVVLSVLALMASVYLVPNYTDNLFYYLFFIAFAFSLRIVSVGEVVRNPMVQVLLALITWTAMSSLWAHDSGRYGPEVLKHGVYLFVALIVVVAATQRFGVSWVLSAIMTTAIICAAGVVVATYFLATEKVAQALLANERLTHWSLVGMAGNPIHSGFFVGLATLFAIHYFRSTQSTWRSLLFLLLAVGMGGFVLLTKSRGAIFFLFVTVVLLMCLIRPWRRLRDLTLLGVGVAVLCAILVADPGMLLSRIGGESIRMDILNAYGKLYLASPLVGVGWSDDLGIVTQGGIAFSKPHNAFFHVLLVGGPIGLALFALLTLYPLWFALRSRQQSTVVIGLWLLFGSLYIAVDGRYPVRHPSAQWLYYWMPLYLLIGRMMETRRGPCQAGNRSLSSDTSRF